MDLKELARVLNITEDAHHRDMDLDDITITNPEREMEFTYNAVDPNAPKEIIGMGENPIPFFYILLENFSKEIFWKKSK